MRYFSLEGGLQTERLNSSGLSQQVLQYCRQRTDVRLRNSELERTRKEAVVAHFEVYVGICLEMLRNTVTIVHAHMLLIHYKLYTSLSYTSVMACYII